MVSGHDESAQSLDLQLEVSTNSEQQTKKEAKEEEEVDVVNTQEVDVESTQYEDQTMETTDPDLIFSGVQDIKPMAFHPFSLYMRKQVATSVNINVGRKHGLGLRVDALRYGGTGELCTDNFNVHTVDGDGDVDGDSEYGSDSEDSVQASQDSAIGLQERVPENPSPVPSDVMTVLYPNPEEGDTLLSCTLIADPGHTLPKSLTCCWGQKQNMML